MVRLLFIVIAGLVVLASIIYLLYQVLMTPRRRLLLQFERMKRLILAGVDEADHERAEQLLEDCRHYLDHLVRAQKRLEALDEMAESASDLTGARIPDDVERLERDIQEDISHFVSEMAHISSQLRADERQSLERLQTFADEIEERQTILAELEELEI